MKGAACAYEFATRVAGTDFQATFREEKDSVQETEASERAAQVGEKHSVFASCASAGPSDL